VKHVFTFIFYRPTSERRLARPHPLPTSTTVATLRPKPRDDRPHLHLLMGGPVLQGSPTLRTRLQRDFHRLLDGLLGRPTPAPDDGPVSAHPGKRAPPNAVPAAPRLPGRRSASAPPPTAPGAIPLGPGAAPIQPRAADNSDNWTSGSSSSIITYPETLNKYQVPPYPQRDENLGVHRVCVLHLTSCILLPLRR
jgi:hypothetical protein